MSEALTKVTYEVLRYTPGVDAKPRMQSYEVPAPKGLTVLDGLLWIKENLDPTLSWRSSCRMGVCGSCAMFINGLPRLACANQVAHLGGTRVVVKPLPNYAIIRDLVPDLEPFFAKHAAIKPWLIRKNLEELNHPTGEYFQSQKELINYIQFAYCIKCGACLSACPTVATDDSYLGPQALAQAWRYIADSRDEGAAERAEEVFSGHGAFRCHFAGACSQVCPKGVDPAFAIQLMKQFMFMQKLGACKEKHGTEVAPPVENWTPREGIPKAPEPSV
ncbi:MAG TPA: succinate dehydrogenase iron-sulfur subunit [bacterium]|nr:succinate dehydrogenase iron-sulfur subunit [bacterium]HPR89280.1 succinate dehydrogenase iron-sulfur subunit [bacterium]